MSIINSILFVLLVFLTGPVCNVIGISNGNTIHLLILGALYLLNINHVNQGFKQNRELRNSLIFYILLLIATFIISKNDLVGVIGWLTLPVTCSIVLTLDGRSTNHLKIILIVFFIVECVLSIIERQIGINFFPNIEDDYYLQMFEQGQEWQFRSNSLLGNPLFNANFVSFVLCLLLCCDKINILFRFFLSVLGLFAILGFNARGAMIVTTVLVIYKLYRIIKYQNNKTYKFLLYAIIVSSFYYAVDFVVNSDWGGRLMQDELLDGSAQARMVFSDYLNEISLFSFPSWVSLKNKSENSILFILISWGILIGTFLMYFVIRYFWSNIKHYQREVRYILLLSSIGIGSLNNNLAGPGLFIWFLMYIIVFRNELQLNKH